MVTVAILLLGLCLGSFVNALVWRVREQELHGAKAHHDLSITRGRSVCPNCRHRLGVRDLVPVLSWLSLGCRCRYCKTPISKQYPVVELATGILAAVSFLVWPHVVGVWDGLEIAAFVAWLGVLTGLIALAVYDIRWFLLPDRIVFPLTGLGFLYVLLKTEGDIVRIGSALVGALLIAGLFFALFQFSKGQWIGGGDVKLGVLLGLLAGGLVQAMLLLFLSSLLGTLYSATLLASGKQQVDRKTRVPFGPFLITAAIIVVLVGGELIKWYSDFIMGI